MSLPTLDAFLAGVARRDPDQPEFQQAVKEVMMTLWPFVERNPRYPDAPQVPKTVLINPELTPLSDEMEDGWEGCLSVPGLRGMVPRHTSLRYTGFDLMGQRIERVAEGFHARVVQHECDHLRGILYPMRVKDFSKFGFTEVLFPELNGVQSDD